MHGQQAVGGFRDAVLAGAGIGEGDLVAGSEKTDSMPRRRSTNQRFRKSSMTSPMLFVWLLASVVAARLGR